VKLLYGHDADVENFVSSLIPNTQNGFGPCRAIGVIDADGALVGGMIYNNYDPESGVIEMSGAAINKRWLNKKTLHGLFAYPFDGLHCQMVMMRNSADDKPLHRMLSNYGFSRWDIPRFLGREKNGVLWALTDDDWRSNRFQTTRKGHT
jgi:RimJ/RimL family protein N-acetyltransferase